jgi:hypothetical protein
MILEKFDTNFDGRLNYEEFKRLMLHAYAHQDKSLDKTSKDLMYL